MIAYLSKKTNRVFKTYEDAREDAVTYTALRINEPYWDTAMNIASHIIAKNPIEYISQVFLHI